METPDIEPKWDGAQDHAGASSRKALADVRRELSEEEISTPAVQRMLLDELERLDKEVAELRQLRDSFHSADKDAEVLRERLRANPTRDVCLGVGAALMGWAPSLSSPLNLGIVACLGVVLLGVAVFARRSRS